MLLQILWLLFLIVLVIKGYYKTAAAIVLVPLVLVYGLIFVLAGASSRSSFDNIPSRVEMPQLQPFNNLNEVTALPIKYETSVITSLS